MNPIPEHLIARFGKARLEEYYARVDEKLADENANSNKNDHVGDHPSDELQEILTIGEEDMTEKTSDIKEDVTDEDASDIKEHITVQVKKPVNVIKELKRRQAIDPEPEYQSALEIFLEGLYSLTEDDNSWRMDLAGLYESLSHSELGLLVIYKKPFYKFEITVDKDGVVSDMRLITEIFDLLGLYSMIKSLN